MEDEKQRIFIKMKSLLSSYVPPLVVAVDEDGHYEIKGNKDVIVGKRKVNGIFFASVIIRKHHVGFYFFPIYTHRENFSHTPEHLMKLLKGKSCFHLKKYDDAVFEAIDQILVKGFGIYKEDDWL
ncbi:MAG: hypothetical protein MI740_08460 [Halanaerobiales bacterium]|uniref:hypothetical protein n=1 Tax=Methanolobus sp. ZRKC2 TaxID=3125783 RepID=UPI0032436993|nr:hypothetical protein [Halanaerobiales bacterium]